MAITDHINLHRGEPAHRPERRRARPALPEPARRLRPRPARRAARHGPRPRHRRSPTASTSRSAARASRRPAEIRAFRTLGADAVGMSTVHETIVARHAGLRVAAVSTITNLAEGLSAEPLSHEQTLRDAQGAAGDLSGLLDRVRGTAAMSADDLRRALAVVDLTRLERPDDAAAIDALRRQGGHRRGPRRRDLRLPASGSSGSSAPASPSPRSRTSRPARTTRTSPRARRGAAVEAGAAEIDVVVPWQAFLAGDETAIAAHRRRDARRDRRRRRPQGDPRDGLARRRGRGPAAPASRPSARARTS